MPEPNDKLTKPVKLGFKPIGAHAKLAEAQDVIKEPLPDPDACTNRIALVFDDSGSMSGTPLQDAKKAVDSFINNCNPRETSIALRPLNAEARPLTNKYAVVAMEKEALCVSGSTPLYSCLKTTLEQVKLTRAVVFSDGEPDGSDISLYEAVVIELYKKEEIPVDTIYIGKNESKYLKKLSDDTGGIYMKFSDTKTLASSLKYLTPGLRGLLVNEDIKARIERGEQV